MDTNEANGIYAFGLPSVAENVRFTCVFCGGPTIALHEIADEVCCDVCYLKKASLRREIDSQYRFMKIDIDEHWSEIAEAMR